MLGIPRCCITAVVIFSTVISLAIRLTRYDPPRTRSHICTGQYQNMLLENDAQQTNTGKAKAHSTSVCGLRVIHISILPLQERVSKRKERKTKLKTKPFNLGGVPSGRPVRLRPLHRSSRVLVYR